MPNSINNLTLKSLNLLEYYQQDRNNCGIKLALDSFDKTNEKELLALLGSQLYYSRTYLLTYSHVSRLLSTHNLWRRIHK